MATNTTYIEKQIATYEKLKANPLKQYEKYQKILSDLGTGEGLTGVALKQYEAKKKQYTKLSDVFDDRVKAWDERIAKLKGKLPEEPPPEEPPPEEPPVTPPVTPGTPPGSTIDPEALSSQSAVTRMDTEVQEAAGSGRRGKQRTILTSPEGVMDGAQRIIKKLQKVT